jgi:translation initiation factor 6
MHVLKADFHGNPNIGLYCFCNNNFCLVPQGISDKLKKNITKVLDVPVFEITMAGTSLVGVFVVGNDNSILIPEIVFENEIKKLKKFKIKYSILNSSLTALNNNILCNNNACIINPDYKKEQIDYINEVLKVPVKKGMINDLKTIGSLARITDKNGLISHDVSDFEKKFLQNNLKVNLTEGTINFGSPYISAGLLCNKNGFIAGNISGGPELANSEIALGFIE